MKFQDTAGLYSTLLTHMKLSSRFKQDFCDRFEKCFRSVFFSNLQYPINHWREQVTRKTSAYLYLYIIVYIFYIANTFQSVFYDNWRWMFTV